MLRSYLPSSALCLGALLLLATACSRNEPAASTPVTNAATAVEDSLDMMPYDFEDPAFRFELPDELVEISGLTVLDEEHLGAIEDENGRLYFLSMETGEVMQEEKFADDGDYEGIALAGTSLYVLRSDGDLYQIDDWQDDKFGSDKHETRLGGSCDAEGLAYDEANNRLLIACKESPGAGLKDQKAIYGYDLATGKVSEKPVFTISLEEFNTVTYPDDGPLNAAIREAVHPVVDLSGFKPSGLDIHPITGNLYILSSVQQAVVVLSAAGAVEHIWKLPDSVLKQPEGIAFLPNGDLIISSEGKGGNAVMIRFTYQPAE